jgi:peptidoglycan/LPS O-acetylase OafA/YrhL
MISGFVIAHLLITKQEPYGGYLRRRTWRIFPIYLVCLVVAIAIAPAQIALHTAPWVDQGPSWAAGFNEEFEHFWLHLGLHLTLLQGIVPDSVLPYSSWTILGPAWSLSLEWQFYLVAPLLMFCLRRSMLSCGVTTLLLLSVSLAFHSGMLGTWRFPSMLLLGIPFFLIGILTRLFYSRISSSSIWWTLGLGMAAAYLLRDVRQELCIWTLSVVAMRWERLQNGNPLVRLSQFITANHVITTLGKASYSTYLIHVLLLSFLAAIFAQLNGSLTLSVARFAGLATLVLLPGVSLLAYRYVERPGIRWGSGARSSVAPLSSPVNFEK